MIRYLSPKIFVTALFVSMMLVSFVVPAHPAEAAAVEIILGDSGSTSWALGPLKPGDSGTKTISIQNAGSNRGDLTLWISDILNTEGTSLKFESPADKAGELADYLTMKVTADRISTNISMPALLTSFPGSAVDSHFIKISALLPGETVDFIWVWKLPEETGNIVQGDGLSFTINFLLEDFSTPSPTPSNRRVWTEDERVTAAPTPSANPTPEPVGVRNLDLDIEGTTTSVGITDDGRITDSLSATTQGDNFSLSISSGTQLLVSNSNRPDAVAEAIIGDTIPQKIAIDIQNDIPSLPEGWIQVSPAYDINGLTNGYLHGIQMDQPATLLIKYNVDSLPESVDALATFYYSYQSGWTELSPPAGFVAEAGQCAAATDHFSLFAVLAKPGKTVGPPPAHFLLQSLMVNPTEITVGESSDVRVRVSNNGGMPGEYSVQVRVNGIIQKSQSVHLEPGDTQDVGLVFTPEQNGIYTVSVGFLSLDLQVDPRPVAEASNNNYWWLLYLSLGLSVLALVLFILRKRKGNGDTVEN